MPKKSRRSGGKSAMSPPANNRVYFKEILTVSLSSTTAQYTDVSIAGLGGRTAAIAQTFGSYHVDQLNIEIQTSVGTAVVAYEQPKSDTTATTFDEAGECAQSILVSASTTIPRKLKIPGSFLRASDFPHYKTIVGAADPTEEIQGRIIYAPSTASATLYVHISGVLNFTDPVPIGLTPKPHSLPPLIEKDFIERMKLKYPALAVLMKDTAECQP